MTPPPRPGREQARASGRWVGPGPGSRLLNRGYLSLLYESHAQPDTTSSAVTGQRHFTGSRPSASVLRARGASLHSPACSPGLRNLSRFGLVHELGLMVSLRDTCAFTESLPSVEKHPFMVNDDDIAFSFLKTQKIYKNLI